MKIKILKDSTVQGERVKKGDLVDFSQDICEILIQKGRASKPSTNSKKGKSDGNI
jgi:hypothetical protein